MNAFWFSLSAIPVGWKRQFTPLSFIAMTTLAFMAGKVTSPTNSTWQLYCQIIILLLFVVLYTDVNTASFGVAHNCLDPLDGDSASVLPYFPRISTSPSPLPPLDSPPPHTHTYPIMLLSSTQDCHLISYFLLQYHGPWVAVSSIVSVFLLFVCFIVEKEVCRIYLNTYYQNRATPKHFSEQDAVGGGTGRVLQFKTHTHTHTQLKPKV